TVVIFTGQPLLTGPASCPSTPSVRSITVAPGATVNFADRLGVAAMLWAGDSHTHLEDGQMVPVTFKAGPMQVTMQMLPDCTPDLGSHGPMTVNVTAPTSGPSTVGGSGTGGSGGATTSPKLAQSPTPEPAHSSPSAGLSSASAPGTTSGAISPT